MTPMESVLEFILRRLTTNELSTVGDLDRCDLYLALIPEIVNLCLQLSSKKLPTVRNFISSLINASIRNFRETNSTEELKLKEQVKKVTSIASLAVVCELMDRKPEAHLEDLPSVDALKRFTAFSQFNEVLKKPSYIEEKTYVRKHHLRDGEELLHAMYVTSGFACVLS